MQKDVDIILGKKLYPHHIREIIIIFYQFLPQSISIPSFLMCFPNGSGKTLVELATEIFLGGIDSVCISLITFTLQQAYLC